MAKKAKARPQRALAKIEPAPPQNLVELLWRAVRDKSIEVAKMKEIMALERGMIAAEAERQFAIAMHQAQSEMETVIRDAENKHTHSKYARLETVLKMAQPIIHRNGFTMSYSMSESNKPNHYRFICRTSHTGGHTQKDFYDLPADDTGPEGKVNKNAVQAIGSSSSYARRQIVTMLFDIRVADLDDDGNTAMGMPISQQHLEGLRSLIKEIKASEKDVCEWLQIKKLEDLTTARLSSVSMKLAQRAAKQHAAN